MSHSASAAATQQSPLKGIFLVLIAFLIFSIQDVIVKLMSSDYALLQIVLLRTLFTIPTVLLIVYFNGGFQILRIEAPSIQYWRGLMMFLAYMFFFMALAALPYSVMIALFFSGPLFITALSVFMLGEKVGWQRWLAVLVGFGGVVVIIRPGDANFDIATIYAVVAAFCYAMSIVLTRKSDESGAVTTFYTMAVYLVCALILSPVFAAITLPADDPSFQFLSMAWNRPVPLDLLIIFFLSLCWGIGMVLLSTAYRSTPVATLAPFEYFSIIYGILFGYLIWQEIPTLTMLAGVILIVGSGLFIIYRERQLGIS